MKNKDNKVLKKYFKEELNTLKTRLKEIVEEGLTDRGAAWPIESKIKFYELFLEHSDKLTFLSLGKMRLLDNEDITVTSGGKVKVKGFKKWYQVNLEKMESVLVTGEYTTNIKELALEVKAERFDSVTINEDDMDEVLDNLFEPYVHEDFTVNYRGEEKIITPIMMLSETQDFFYLNEKWCWDNTLSRFVYCNEELTEKIQYHIKMFKRLTN